MQYNDIDNGIVTRIIYFCFEVLVHKRNKQSKEVMEKCSMKKILPINENIKLTSYVHHSYPNSIINREDIAMLYIQGLNDWTICSSDVSCELDLETISIKEKKGRKANNIELKRLCNESDEMIVKLHDIKLDDAMSYVLLGIRREKDGLNEENAIFSFWWNQYDVTIGKEHLSPGDHFFAYYKLRKENDRIQIDISTDMNEWKPLYEKKLDENGEGNNLQFYVKFFFGNNQYEQWLNMNYIQLFYNENDPNTAYLDYYMFPRKLSDASYQYFCNFLDTEYVDFRTHQLICDTTIHNYIVESIKQGYYLNVCLNEFYVADRKAYKTNEYEHYNLIYGFDDEKHLYYILGYNYKGKIVTATLSYEDMDKSFCDTQIVRYLYRVNKYEYRFQISIFICEIEEFLNSENSSKKFGALLANSEGKYGIGIFDELVYSRVGRKLLVSDLRISYVLYEHSLLMLEKLKFLKEYGYITDVEERELMIQCKSMLKLAELLKNLVVKNSVRFINNQNRIFESLIQLKEKVRIFCMTLLDTMKCKEQVKNND